MPNIMRSNMQKPKTMKQFKSSLYLAGAAMTVLLWMAGFVTTATAGTIFFDALNGSGALTGRAPTTRPGTETWTSATAFTADGAIANGGNCGAYLPFTPVAGNRYVLSADMNVTGTGQNWIALGFTAANTTTVWYSSPNNGAPWMLLRGDRGTGQGQDFQGPVTAGAAAFDAPTNVVNLRILLDTTPTLWTVQWFTNGVSVRGPVAYSSNPTINYVGVGQNGQVGTVHNLTLTRELFYNPSFEMDTFASSPGSISSNSAISGWTAGDNTKAGLNPAGGANVMADNGAIPDGAKVAWLQPTNTLKTTLTGLTNGTTYTVGFRVNSKSGNTPTLRVSIDGAASLFDAGSVVSVGGTAPYLYAAFSLPATSTSHTLWITNDAAGTNTLLLDNFSANVSTSGWSYAIWTNDASAGVDNTKNYTHAYHFNSSATATISNINFLGIAGLNPTVANSLYSSGLGSAYANDTASVLQSAGGGSAVVANNFIYGGNPAIYTLQGLVPGKQYVATFYSTAWDVKSYGRAVTWSSGSDRMSVNQDQFNTAGVRNGIRVSYAYTAPASGSITLSNVPFSTAVGTFHTYGLANYEATAQALPVIGLNPKSQVSALGNSFTLVGTAGGGTPLSIRWLTNGVVVAGQTNRWLSITNVGAGNFANYQMWVSNSAGMVTSAVASVTSGMIANPSFEADSFPVNPGTVSLNYPISGWTNSAPGNVGLTPAGEWTPYFNGTVPDGNQAASISATAWIGTWLAGLTPATTYTIQFRANGSTPGQKATLHTAIDGQSMLDMRVSSTNAYRYIAFDFTAANTTHFLSITNDTASVALLDNFSIAVSTAKWSYAVWTNDATADVTNSRTYTHAYAFSTANAPVIGGVRFTGIPGANPAVVGKFSSSGFAGTYTTFVNTLGTNGGGSALMSTNFIYNGALYAPQVFSLSNLVPYVEYVATVYGSAFDTRFVGRAATFTNGNDMMTVNEDHFGQYNGIRVSYRYLANANGTATITYLPTDVASVSSFHTHGFSNYERTSTNKPNFYTQPSSAPAWMSFGSTLLLTNFLIGGQAPVSYQWMLNGAALLNQTNGYLQLIGMDTTNAGTYTLVASNAQGVTVSSNYVVNVGYITNPSFEADTFPTYPGYVSGNFPITGWTASAPANAGINPAGTSPFADNGTIPDGSQTAFIQSYSNLSSLSTPITSLVSGQVYTASFRFNSRNNQKPIAHVTIDGQSYLDMLVSSVGGTAPYKYASFDFMATNSSQVLIVSNYTTSADTTLLVDDFRVNVSTSKWSYAAWNDDTTSGVDATKNYSHAWHFGSANSTVISNITFLGSAGASPSPEIVGTGFTSAITNYSNTLTTNGGGSAVLGRDFLYAASATAQSLTITGLVPGVQYLATIYTVGWSNDLTGKLYGRAATFAAGTDRMTINQDQFGMFNGIRVSYAYTAGTNGTMTFNMAPSDAASTLHLYGFANCELASTNAPVVYHQPLRFQYAKTGGTAAFYAQAGGQGPLTIQWYKDGNLLVGQTNLSLLLSGISAANAGAYSVAITNALGGTVSSNATLAINDTPFANPSFEVDTFSVAPGTVAANFPITGWTASSGANVGLSPAGGLPSFSTNAPVPDGSQVAYLQGSCWISTVLSGLTAGQTYTVNFRAAAAGANANVRTAADGQSIINLTLAPTNYYRALAYNFTATNGTSTLSITNDAGSTAYLLLDNFSVNVSTSGWSYAVWTNDATSGVDVSNKYTHAVNFGARSFSPVLNGVPFTGLPGANPSLPGEFSCSGFISQYYGDRNTLFTNGGASAFLARDFIYGAVPQIVTVGNLVPGAQYVATFYGAGYDTRFAGRSATFSVGTDLMTINEDEFGQYYGIRVSYRYVADASGTITFNLDTFVTGTFHTYGFSNYELSSPNAPRVYHQPVAYTAAGAGDTVRLAPFVGGAEPLTYQWKKGGVDMPDQTNRFLVLSNVTVADAGVYTLAITNALGGIATTNATVDVGVTVVNPSFESNLFTVSPGYWTNNSAIIGWTTTSGIAGINPLDLTRHNPAVLGTYAPFANAGIIPDGAQVAFMQGPSSLSQTLSGFTPGSTYYVRFYENSRLGFGDPQLAVTMNGNTILAAHAVPSTGYRVATSESFEATNGTMTLTFVESGAATNTVLLDAISVLPLPPTAPSFTTQPQAPATVVEGDTVTFVARALGTAPMYYQWLFNGANLAGQNSATLAVNNFLQAQAGTYQCIASNLYGSATSTVATVSQVYIRVPTLFNTGVDASHNLVVGGTVDQHYQLTTSPDPVYPGPQAQVLTDNVWPVGSPYPANGPFSMWISPATNGVNLAAGPYVYHTSFELGETVDVASFRINGNWGSDNEGVEVRLNGVSLGISNYSANFLLYPFVITNGFVPGSNGLDFVIGNGAGSPHAFRAELSGIALTNPPTAPLIVSQPTNQTVVERGAASFTVGVTGHRPLSYQWYLVYDPPYALDGQTNATLSFSSAAIADEGGYFVVITNTLGSVTSQVAHLGVAYAQPFFDDWDTSTWVAECGFTYQLWAPVNGGGLSYQWYSGLTPLPGQTNAPLTFPNITGAQTGDYWVVISNVFGSATSTVATVTVQDTTPPQIVCPANILTNVSGTSVAVNFAPLATDNCGTPSVVCDPPSGSSFAVGTNTVNCTATDGVSLTTPCSFTIQVQQYQQVTGRVALEFYAGLAHDGNGTRDVTFVASHVEAGVTNYLGTWTQTLTFTAGVADYALLNVLPGATHLSAKTDWTLRKRLPLSFTGLVAEASFTGGNVLPGGDLDHLNDVGLADYNRLAAAWYTTQSAEDIDGSGVVDLDDYFILASHWGETGDPQ